MKVGRDRLQRMYKAMGYTGGIGLENLALAFGPKDVEDQGRFIADLLQPFGEHGVLLLDLHNLYCQIVNWNLDILQALKRCGVDC